MAPPFITEPGGASVSVAARAIFESDFRFGDSWLEHHWGGLSSGTL